MLCTKLTNALITGLLLIWHVPSAAVTLYDVRFNAPTHEVGSLPTTGAGPLPRDTPSDLIIWQSVIRVVSDFGPLGDRPAQLRSETFAQLPELCRFSCVGNLVFGLEDADLSLKDQYNVSYDLVVNNDTVGNGNAFFLIDDQEAGLDGIRFNADGEIVVLESGLPTVIGDYSIGSLVSVEILLDRIAELWAIHVNDDLLYVGFLSGSTFQRFRTGGAANGVIEPGSYFNIAYDNILITATPEPEVGLLVGIGLMLYAVRRYRG